MLLGLLLALGLMLVFCNAQDASLRSALTYAQIAYNRLRRPKVVKRRDASTQCDGPISSNEDEEEEGLPP